jgi:hypothetical protein
MKVSVREPFRVCHDGKVWRAGETADVPDWLAEEWAAVGLGRTGARPQGAGQGGR